MPASNRDHPGTGSLRLAFSVSSLLSACGVCPAAEWPPARDATFEHTTSVQGRQIERYTHGSRMEWGYPATPAWTHPAQETPSPTDVGPGAQHLNSFYVVSPQRPRDGAPLLVWLHSANRTGFVYMGYQFLRTGNPGYDSDRGNVAMAVPEDFYGLYLNTTNAEWWGWSALRDHPAEYADRPTPGERRVLDTIEWVASTYRVDRNRIYLCGASMGGCGALGIGLSRGDMFASIMVWVPAGIGYAAKRYGLDPRPDGNAPPTEREAWTRRISGAGLPDPPIVVDLSAQNDTWSQDHGELIRAMGDGRLPLVLGWGPFGHSPRRNDAARHRGCATVLDFPWLSIRKDAAYPVFTNASSDDRAPWRKPPTPFDETGQINAFFRWDTLRDDPHVLTMRLWLAAGAPAQVSTDVTPRRMQRFTVAAGQTYVWKLSQVGRPIATGSIQPDAARLLTIPQLNLSGDPAELTVMPAP
jgi:poly(3-hydroxybutyrate) depolymerase